ncbi:esterase-5A-like [Drosophila serrata]|uniref:esterase-5A-like n=1 Tax=Drosophila serrata TaxID=7274 RepID=UPI000A1D1B55|nr:esterase-5A-like [Drosophila serrata]
MCLLRLLSSLFLVWMNSPGITPVLASDPLIVEIPNGRLRGRDNGTYYSFESVPYAEPPINDLRFEPPRPSRLHWTETFDASQPPVPCMQWNEFIDGTNKLVGQEDCDPWVVQEGARGRAFELGRIVDCGHTRDSAALKICLKSKSANEIVSAVSNFFVFSYVPFSTFGPVVEPADAPEAFLTQHPREIIKSGKFAQVPWVVSHTTEDGGYNAAMLLGQNKTTGEMWIDKLNECWLDLAPYFLFYRDSMETIADINEYSLNLQKHYLGDRRFSLESYWDVQRMFTDILFKNSVWESLDLHRRYGKSPLYSFVYDNPADSGVGQVLSNRTDVYFDGDDFVLIFDLGALRTSIRPDEEVISGQFIKMLEDISLADDGELIFGNCQFQNNVNNEHFHVLRIIKHVCISDEYYQFP